MRTTVDITFYSTGGKISVRLGGGGVPLQYDRLSEAWD